MTTQEFFDHVQSHPELSGVGLEESSMIIKHTPTNSMYRIGTCLLENTWEDLEAVLTGKREPTSLTYMSRVVGYFSRIDNWNKSKIGELKDRNKGNYAVA